MVRKRDGFCMFARLHIKTVLQMFGRSRYWLLARFKHTFKVLSVVLCVCLQACACVCVSACVCVLYWITG